MTRIVFPRSRLLSMVATLGMAVTMVAAGCTADISPLCDSDDCDIARENQGVGQGKPRDDSGRAPDADEDFGCICTLQYAPVCGEDGTTYGNACQAGCAKVAVAHEGECEVEDDGCICTEEYAPVCGDDGITYGNACNAGCADVAIAHAGACDAAPGEPAPGCTINCLIYEPVCGSDGVTYGCGAEEARCHGVAVQHAGECSPPAQDDCICIDLYAPVCGHDGKTYSNSCRAICAGAVVISDGECS